LFELGVVEFWEGDGVFGGLWHRQIVGGRVKCGSY
jgi:hypothetical protein